MPQNVLTLCRNVDEYKPLPPAPRAPSHRAWQTLTAMSWDAISFKRRGIELLAASGGRLADTDRHMGDGGGDNVDKSKTFRHEGFPGDSSA